MAAVTVAVNLVGNNFTGGAFGAMSNSLAILGSRANSLAHYLGNLSTGTKFAAGAAIAGAASFALFKNALTFGFDAAVELEQGLLLVRQAAQANQDAIPVLTQSINDLAVRTVFGSDEAATAFARLIRSGFSVSQVMYGAGAAANEYKTHAYSAAEATNGLGFEALALAQALKMGAEDGANLAAAAIHMFTTQIQASKDPTQEASRIISDLAGAYQNGARDGGDLLRFLQQVGPTASSAGIQFRDLVTTGDVLAQSMGNMGIAGTRLRYFISALISPTQQQAKEMASLGIWTVDTSSKMTQFERALVNAGGATNDNIKLWHGSVTGLREMFTAAQQVGMIPLDTTFGDWATSNGFLNSALYDSEGNFKGLRNAIDVMNNALKDKTPEERMKALSMLFNVRGGDAGRILSNLLQFDEQYQTIWDRIGNTDVTKMAEQRLNTFKGAIEQFGDSIKSSMALAFLNLLPPMTAFLNKLSELVQKFMSAPPAVHTALGVFILVGTVLSGIVMVVGGVIAVFGLLATAITALGGIAVVGPVILGVGAAIAIVAGIVALAIARWNDIQGVLQRLAPVVEFLKNAFMQFVGFLQGEVLPTLSQYRGVFEAIGTAILVVAGIIVGFVIASFVLWAAIMATVIIVITKLLEAILFVKDHLGALAGAIGSAFGAIGSTVGNFFNMLGTRLHDAITTITGVAGAIASAVAPWVTPFLQIGGAILGAIGSLGGALIGAFFSILGAVLGAIGALTGAIVGGFLRIVGAVAGPIAQLIATVVGGFLSLAGRVGGAIGGFVSMVVSHFTGMAGQAAAPVGNLVSRVVGFFSSLAGQAVGKVASMAGQVVSRFQSLAGQAQGAIQGMANRIVSFINNMANGGAARISSMASQIVARISSMASSAAGQISSMAGRIAGFLGSLVGNAVGAAGRLASGFLGQISNMAGQAVSRARSMGSQIVSAVSSFGGALAGAGRAMIQGLIGGIQGMAGAAVNAARNVVGSAVNAAKSALGIRSPSKVFEEIGRFTIAGYVNAITGGKGAVGSAVNATFTPNVPSPSLSDSILGVRSGIGAGGFGAVSGPGRGGTLVIQNRIDSKQVGEIVIDLTTMQIKQVGSNRMGR